MSYRKKSIIKQLLKPKILILLATIIISLFYCFVPDFQTWLSSNVTFVQNWEEETNTSSSVLIVFGILVIGSFVYLIYDALKESNTEKLEKKVDKLIKEIRRDRKEQKNKL